MAINRPDLTIRLCLDIVIDCTDHRQDFEDVFGSSGDTLLQQLGIVNPAIVDSLRTCIQRRLAALDYQIKKGDIVADPSSTVDNCVFSVNLYAH